MRGDLRGAGERKIARAWAQAEPPAYSCLNQVLRENNCLELLEAVVAIPTLLKDQVLVRSRVTKEYRQTAADPDLQSTEPRHGTANGAKTRPSNTQERPRLFCPGPDSSAPAWSQSNPH